MNDTDKEIFKELRAMRKSMDSGFVIVHQKVDKFKTDLESKIGGVSTDVQSNKESFIVFKAKWFGVGAAAVVIGNVVKPLLEFIKDNHH